jgi:hypothetical protein
MIYDEGLDKGWEERSKRMIKSMSKRSGMKGG